MIEVRPFKIDIQRLLGDSQRDDEQLRMFLCGYSGSKISLSQIPRIRERLQAMENGSLHPMDAFYWSLDQEAPVSLGRKFWDGEPPEYRALIDTTNAAYELASSKGLLTHQRQQKLFHQYLAGIIMAGRLDISVWWLVNRGISLLEEK